MAAGGSGRANKSLRRKRKVSAADHGTATDEKKKYTEEVVLHPGLWRGYPATGVLKWNHVDFDRPSRARVPKRPGLYAFAVQPPHANFPPSSWLFYVGEVGATDSPARTLWKRYKEYLNELETSVRKKVGSIIYRYNGYVRFYYCELDPTINDLKIMETELITALWPYANINDFSAEVAGTRRAFS